MTFSNDKYDDNHDDNGDEVSKDGADDNVEPRQVLPRECNVICLCHPRLTLATVSVSVPVPVPVSVSVLVPVYWYTSTRPVYTTASTLSPNISPTISDICHRRHIRCLCSFTVCCLTLIFTFPPPPSSSHLQALLSIQCAFEQRLFCIF